MFTFVSVWLLAIFCLVVKDYPAWLLFACSLIALGLIRYLKQRYLAVLFIYSSIAVVIVGIQHDQHLHHVVPEDWHGHDITVEGYVQDIPDKREQLTKFRFITKTLQLDKQTWHKKYRLSLTWYHHQQALFPELKAGQYWRLTVRLKPPHDLHNPGQGLRAYKQLADGLHGRGYIVSSKPVERLQACHWRQAWQCLRQKIWDELTVYTASYPGIDQIAALTIGHKAGLAQTQWQLLQQTGVAHLVAISGLHVGFIASLVFWLIRLLWSRSYYLCLLIPAPMVAAYAAIIVAGGYCLLAGMSISTQRAWIMLTVAIGCLISQRKVGVLNAYCLALWLVVLIHPYSVFTLSFHLSFLAVAVLLYTNIGRVNLRLGWLRTQCQLSLGLAPASIFWFSKLSLIGPLCNLLAIPWFGFIVVPLSLFAVLSFFISDAVTHILLNLLQWDLVKFWQLLGFLNSFNWASFNIELNQSMVFFTVIFFVIMCLAPRAWPVKNIAGLALLPIWFWQPRSMQQAEFSLHLLDVGQGLSAIVSTSQHHLIYDTGLRHAYYNSGQSVIEPALKYLGIHAIDMLVVSHADSDHSGGANYLIEHMPIAMIKTSKPSLYQYADYCRAGETWEWDGVRFTFLHPTNMRYQGNNSSCVLRIDTSAYSVLLPGDIEQKVETDLLHKIPWALKADYLIAPHHGSKTSSSMAFLSQVQAKRILLPTGYLNRYHFPHPTILERYRALAADVYDVGRQGALSVYFKVNKTIEKTYT